MLNARLNILQLLKIEISSDDFKAVLVGNGSDVNPRLPAIHS